MQSREILEKIVGFNKKISDYLQAKWQIEADLLAIEQQLLALNKETKKKELLDFEKKIPELSTKIEALAKDRHDVSETKPRFEALKTKYEQVIKDIDELNKEFSKYSIQLRENKQVAGIAKHIKSTYLDPKEKISIISNLDGKITLPILISILGELKNLIEGKIPDIFKKMTGKSILKRSFRSDVSFDTYTNIENLIGDVDIDPLENFTKRDVSEITPQNIDSIINVIINNFSDEIKKRVEIKQFIDGEAFKQFSDYLRIRIYCLFAIKTYQFTDDMQMEYKATQFKFIRKSNNEIINPFLLIAKLAQQIPLFSDIETLLAEAAIWFKGLYQRSYNQIPPVFKNADGGFTEGVYLYIGDNEDRQLNEYKSPLTKIVMAEKHLLQYDSLVSRLPKPILSQDPPKPSASTVVTPLDTVNSLQEIKIEQQDQPVSPALPPQVISHPVLSIDEATLQREVNQSNPSRMSMLVSGLGMFSAVKQILPLAKLKRIENEKPEVKYTFLSEYLDKYSLSDGQIRIINKHKQSIIDGLKGYTRAYFSTHGVPTFLKPRPFTDLFLEKITATQSTVEPSEYLKILCDMHPLVSKGQDALNIVNTLLDTIFRSLLIITEEEESELSAQKAVTDPVIEDMSSTVSNLRMGGKRN